MRHSSSLISKTLLTSVTTALMLSGCGATAPVKQAPDPYDSYYGQAPAGNTFNDSNIIVNPNAPHTYVVQKGDTMWGIARKFLNTPWYWPEVWDKNQGIPNPHLIYPGDVLTLDYAGGDKLMPRIRIDRHGEGEPIASLVPFLLWPRVLDEATLNSAPYILASRDDHILIGPGETIYAKNLCNVQPGTRYAIFHPNKLLQDPKTGEVLGHEVTYGGYSRLERVDTPSTLTVLESSREIHAGDRLLAPVDEIANLNGVIHAPVTKVRADIIALFDAKAISGNYMIVTLNKGQRDGIEVGHSLGVYAPGKDVIDPVCKNHNRIGMELPVHSELPPEKVANLVIYKVTDRVSYGLIMDSSREVQNGDKIGNP
jgi:hypothetical protein